MWFYLVGDRKVILSCTFIFPDMVIFNFVYVWGPMRCLEFIFFSCNCIFNFVCAWCSIYIFSKLDNFASKAMFLSRLKAALYLITVLQNVCLLWFVQIWLRYCQWSVSNYCFTSIFCSLNFIKVDNMHIGIFFNLDFFFLASYIRKIIKMDGSKSSFLTGSIENFELKLIFF